ncbi:MAG: alpha/beta hydrolase [Oscillospiraceae bacterium]|nr:alpha/beta hydrolase [Oscillospiraceae bacterium]
MTLLHFAKHFVTILLVLLMAEFGVHYTPGLTVYADISYGEDEKQTMDIYYPDEPENINEPIDAFIFIHGGSWTGGSKRDSRYFAIPMAKEGYISAAMNYRTKSRDIENPEYYDATLAEMMEDISLAIAKIKDQATEDGVAVNKIALVGDSAGGHLALLYAYSHLNGTPDEAPIPIGFVVGRIAPTNVNFSVPRPDGFGDDSMDSNVLNYVSADTPPTILCYATKDELVFPEIHGFPLRDLLDEFEVPYEYYTFSFSGHTLLHPFDLGQHQKAYSSMMDYANLYF